MASKIENRKGRMAYLVMALGVCCLTSFATSILAQTSRIVGRTLDTDDVPVPGVTVELVRDGQTRATRITDAGGKFLFGDVDLGSGRFEIRFILAGQPTGVGRLRADTPLLSVGFGRFVGEVAAVNRDSWMLGKGAAKDGWQYDIWRSKAKMDPVHPLPPPPPPPPPPPSSDDPNNHAIVPVFYATDRNRVSYTPLFYDGNRDPSSQLHLGRVDVSIPRHKHELGNIERPNIWTLWQEDPQKHFILVNAVEQPYQDFYTNLSEVVAKSDAKQAFVFIHGFNVEFQDAVFRTAQLAYDLGFNGAPILYSWPSMGHLLDYRIDEKNNVWTVNHLRYFLEDVRKRSGAKVIHLLAHSMGNRALTAALADMAIPATGEAKFSQLILTAPDIDAGIFPDLATKFRKLAERVTIYASDHDYALEAAKKYDTFQRVGSTKPQIILAEGCETVDASKVDTSLLGHSYVGDSTTILSDIFHVLNGVASGSRSFLSPQGQPPKLYWAFR